MSKSYTKAEVTTLPKQEVEIKGEISVETLTEKRSAALARIKESVEIDGFRKGNAPENMIISKVGEMKILEEAAELALETAYPEILEDKKIDAIGRPAINVTKLAPGNNLEFTIRTAIAPLIELADYKKIIADKQKESKETLEVSEEEIDSVITDVRRNVAHAHMHEKEGIQPEDHSHGEIKDEDLPALDEAFLKEIGGFASIEDLREKIRINMLHEKEHKAKDKHRTEILESILTASKIEVPQIIIDSELEKMLAQFKDDISRSGISYEDYLKHIKKEEKDIRGEWQETAEKRAKANIILHEIARNEHITPEEETIKAEMEKILSHDKNLERFRVRMFVENFLTNEMTFRFLETGTLTK